MGWLDFLNPKKAVKDAAKKAMREFKWSDRERTKIASFGYTDEQIALSEKLNRIGGEEWVERQVK